MGSVPGLHDGGVEERVHEVGVVGQPAHSKYHCHCSEHFHNLKNCCFRIVEELENFSEFESLN